MLISPLPPPRVLIIDDDPDISSVLVAALEAVGCTVTSETNSAKAEAACVAAHPELVLVDMMMPGRSGIELLAPLHEIAPDAIICIMTGMGDPALLQRSLRSGAWNVLCKPYSLSDLAELIDMSLRLSASLREEAGAGYVTKESEWEFSGDHRPSSADLARLIAIAAETGNDPDVSYRKLPLLAQELLDNAFEHGTHGDAGIHYGSKLKTAPESLELTVWDDGPGFDGKTKIRQMQHSTPCGKMSGLQLVSALADEIRFNKQPNSITVIWHSKLLAKHEGENS
ncbi:MAG: response regulator [bacterium]|nr:response regulator [bacterium]